jgi:hypothetical protein
LYNGLDLLPNSKHLSKKKPQMPIEVQLMAFLSCVGFSGNAAGIHMISLDLEIGRGTV